MSEEKTKRYWKVLSKNNQHFDMTYVPNEWNTDVLPYNPYGSCRAGGLYFTDTYHILHFLEYGDGIAEVLDWKDDDGVKDFYSEECKVKAHSIRLGEKRPYSIELFEELIKNGAEKIGSIEGIMSAIAKKDDVDMLKWFLVNFSADYEYFHDKYQYSLVEGFIIYSARYDSVNILKYIMDQKFFELLSEHGRDKFFTTSVFLAIMKQKPCILTMLLEQDVYVNKLSSKDIVDLFQANFHRCNSDSEVGDIMNILSSKLKRRLDHE